ncbi:PqqD family protein [Candidatus Thiosymbion oneisti]|uniref:PqqD family protein n=1 Tax=Candidatus Thiosymbion oneisti TaxID=589554 RepID=UPI00159F0B2D|nr:PqqD family protein [Candidatus Thiosymbion oneisti]
MTPLPKEITISSKLLFQELGDETVLLDLENELYYSLDEVGMRLWQLFAENGNPEAAMKQLLTEYDVDEARLRKDMHVLIDELREAKLITVTP